MKSKRSKKYSKGKVNYDINLIESYMKYAIPDYAQCERN